MSQEALVALVLGAVGMMVSWAVWVSVTTFKHAQEIALIKQEIKLLGEIREVLMDIKEKLRQS